MKMPEYVKIGGVCYSTEITDQFYEGKNNVDGGNRFWGASDKTFPEPQRG